MRAPLSVVIPTLNAEDSLPECLNSLFEGVQADLIRELIIVDGGSTDRTIEIADEVGATVFSQAPSRGGQLRKGCVEANGEWLLVLHADSSLGRGWSEEVAEHMTTGKAGFFRLRFSRTGCMALLVAGWANLRSRCFGLPFGDQGIVLPKKLYDQVGGFQDIPIMEDMALAQALKGQLRPLSSRIVTDPVRYEAQGWLRRGTANLRLQIRFLRGVPPETLAAEYRRD